MKLKYTLLGLAALLPTLASARPASPELLRMTNADGSVVELRAFGDADFNYYTDASQSVIMERDADGNWAPARRDGRVLTTAPEDLALLESKTSSLRKLTSPKTRMAPIDKTEGRTSFPTLAQDVHSLVVLIEYSDTPFTVPNPREAFDKMLNEEGYSAYGSRGSARDYYVASSGGKFTPIFDVTEVVKLSHSSEYYTATFDPSVPGSGRNGRFGEAIQEALLYLDAQGMDFSKYDYDGDGDIDTVFFYYSGYGQADSHLNTTIWPHQADFSRYTTEYANTIGLEPLYLDGKRMGPYACSNELNFKVPAGQQQPWLDGIGAFCHEFGHVLGLPDLYDTTGSNAKTPGYWSVMDTGSYNGNSTCPPLFSAYEKWVCRWLEFPKESADRDGVMPLEGTTVTVPSLAESNEAVRFSLIRFMPGYPVFPNEFFILESRPKTGWDAELPGEGMLIWHIDFKYADWYANHVNTSSHLGVSLCVSDPATNQTAWPANNGINYTYPGADNALTIGSNASMVYNDKFWLGNIRFDSETGVTTLDFNKVNALSDAVPTLNTPAITEQGNAVVLSWQPLEGATDYIVSLTAPNFDRQIAIGDLDNTHVGTKTWVESSPFATSFTSKTCTATVRAIVNGFPSTNVATTSFVPNTLAVTGVGEVTEATAAIVGGQGCILAPAGARAFNMQGVETGLTDLPAGLYIVVSGQQSAKVVVR